jgi:hypothetical protein
LAAGVIALAGTAAAGCLGRTSGDAWAWSLVPTSASPIQGVGRPNAIGVSDFDLDGRTDVAVLGSDPGELLVLLNRGAGLLVPSAQGVIAAGRSASGLGVGDVDGNGDCDLVVSHHDDFELLVLLSDGDGTFHAAPSSPQISSREGTPHSHNLALADVDRDGRLDVVQAQSNRNVVLVLLGDGKGGFAPAPCSPIAAGRHPYTVVVADFDANGAPDFAVPNLESGDLTIGLGLDIGRGAGAFAAPGPPAQLGSRPLGLAAGDVNDDGRVDLVVNRDDVSMLDILLGDGTGSFRRSASLVAQGRIFGQTLADLDGDGIDDVAVPCIDSEAVAVWPGRRGGELESTPRTFRTPGTDSQVMAIADLDGDGVPDVVTAGWDRPTVTVLLGRKE